jgi:hypothetical protein
VLVCSARREGERKAAQTALEQLRTQERVLAAMVASFTEVSLVAWPSFGTGLMAPGI